MQPTKILLGNEGYNIKNLARSTMLNQLAFDYNRAHQTQRKDNPVADAATAEGLKNIFGPQGEKTHQVVLNAEELMDAHAAAYVLFQRGFMTPDPETGRPATFNDRRLVSLPDMVKRQVDRNLAYNLTKALATAESSGADPEIVTSELKKAIIADLERQADAVRGPWLESVLSYKDESDEDLVDVVLEAVTNAGRNIPAEITRACDKKRDDVKKRQESGQFATLPADIWAYCTVALKGETA